MFQLNCTQPSGEADIEQARRARTPAAHGIVHAPAPTTLRAAARPEPVRDTSRALGARRFMIVHRNAKQLIEYWLGLRETQDPPSRAQIDPNAIRNILPHVFMLERIDRDHVVFRLAGTEICSLFGREFRAHNFLSFWYGDCRAQARTLVDGVLSAPGPGVIAAHAETVAGDRLDLEWVLLPITSPTGSLSRVLGCMHVRNQTEMQNRRIKRPLVRQKIFFVQRPERASAPAEPILAISGRAELFHFGLKDPGDVRPKL